jgi:hypothetical protein
MAADRLEISLGAGTEAYFVELITGVSERCNAANFNEVTTS